MVEQHLHSLVLLHFQLIMTDEATRKRPLLVVDEAKRVTPKSNSGFKEPAGTRATFKSSSKKQRRYRKANEDDVEMDGSQIGHHDRETNPTSKMDKKPGEQHNVVYQSTSSKSLQVRRIDRANSNTDNTSMDETITSLKQLKQSQQQRVHEKKNQLPPGETSQHPRITDSIATKPDKTDVAYDSDGSDFDRQFYLADEGGYVVDSSEMQAQGQLGRFLFVNDKTKQREAEMEERRRNPNYRGGKAATQTQQRFNARQSALQDDQDAWEENRLLSSGAASRGEVSLDVSSDNDTRVTLLVHQLKPPFLAKSSVGLAKQTTAATVKDNSSDFCKMAREGSVTLMRLRQEKDKNTMRQKFWELGGTKMGDAMRVKQDDQGEQPDAVVSSADGKDGEVDYKKSTGYASHMAKQKQEAASEFAKTKSIRQQREFLPIYSVREELLNVIRENNVVVSQLFFCRSDDYALYLSFSLDALCRLLLEKPAVVSVMMLPCRKIKQNN